MREIKKNKNSNTPFRLNILFLVVFLLFSTLILRLGTLQIVFGEEYQREIEQKDVIPINSSVPRGKIYDTNGKLVVGNIALKAITYTRSNSVKQDEMLDIATKLAKLINKDTDADFKSIGKRDRQDFWIIKHPNDAKAKITKKDEDRLNKKELDKKEYDKEIYDLTRERITDKELNSFTKQELEVLAIFSEMARGTTLSPQIIKNKDVTDEEFAVVSEHLDTLPGVDTTTDWDRYQVFKDIEGNGPLSSVLGKVTSSKEGLPNDTLGYLLARGYSRNDRVGKSYLERQYEDVLQGQKEVIKNITDKKSGNVLESKVFKEGKSGNDLILAIDIELQQKIDEIIQDKLSKAKVGQPYMDRALVSVMNPKTGDMLAMAGKQYIKNNQTNQTEVVDFALGNMTTSYSMGSVVKGATVLTGYQTGAISPGEKQYDQPMKFKGTASKSSWNQVGFGSIDDLFALKRSSNVYMFLTAMKIGGQQTYIPNGYLSINKIAAITKFRNNFAQFGLGIRTGIDLPGEQTGYGGGQIPPDAGKILDFAIGQYDTYTPLQLVQYVSTIANGGFRIQPHLVKEIREPNNSDELGPIIKEMNPKILNKIDMKDSWITRVQDGFKQVVNDPQGTGYGTIKNKQYKIAGKTGTAQALYDGPLPVHPMTWNVTFAGYAPYDNPEIAISVVVPWSTTDATHVNLEIADEIFKAYFDLKEKRANEGVDGAVPTE